MVERGGRSLFSHWLALSAVSEIDGDKDRDLICQLKLFNYLVHLLTITYEEKQGILWELPWKAVGRTTPHSHNHCCPQCSCTRSVFFLGRGGKQESNKCL